jgi:hypothetical protein
MAEKRERASLNPEKLKGNEELKKLAEQLNELIKDDE